MKKKIVISLVLATVVGGVLLGISASAHAFNQELQISKESAIEIALKHADVNESDASKLSSKLDIEDGVVLYDVEFNVGAKEYDFEIDAQTGDIIEWDSESVDEEE